VGSSDQFRPAQGYEVSKVEAVAGGWSSYGVGSWVLLAGEDECGGLVPSQDGRGGFVTGKALLQHRKQHAHAAAVAAAADDLRLPLPAHDPTGGALLQTHAWGALIQPVAGSGMVTPRGTGADAGKGGAPPSRSVSASSELTPRRLSDADLPSRCPSAYTPRGSLNTPRSPRSLNSPRSAAGSSAPAGRSRAASAEWRHAGRAPAFGGGGGQYTPRRELLRAAEREVVSTLTVVSADREGGGGGGGERDR